MIGLRTYARDASLPALVGEPELCAPTCDEVVDRVVTHLARPGRPPILRATWEYARWKPGHSITLVHAIEFVDGERRLVTTKRYAGAKAEGIASGFDPVGEDTHLLPFAIVEGARTCLYSFPCDRVLRGAWRLLDHKRTARLLNALPLASEARIRWRESKAVLLRYKPERRAVFQLDLGLSDAEMQFRARRLAVRVLPPDEAVRIAATRRACFSGDRAELAPALLFCEDRTGLIFEAWLDIDVPAPDDFRAAHEAGAALARLHGRPSGVTCDRDLLSELQSLFNIDPKLGRLAGGIDLVPLSEPTVWIHADLHPDQVARERSNGATRLLDFDAVRRGAPSQDLASWVADHLASRPALDAATALAPLLEGYRAAGGVAPSETVLENRIAIELVRRAAACIRRLEQDARGKAEYLLTRATSISRGMEALR